MLCFLFGHKSLENESGGREYMKVVNSNIDGIGRWHIRLEAECPRCGEKYDAGNAHVPGTYEYSHSLRQIIRKQG